MKKSFQPEQGDCGNLGFWHKSAGPGSGCLRYLDTGHKWRCCLLPIFMVAACQYRARCLLSGAMSECAISVGSR